MSEIVVILGAGASAQAGAPVMSDFLDVAYDLMKHGQNREIAADSDLVFKGKDALQRVHSKAELDLQNLEAVFAAFEMAQLLKRLPDFKEEEIEKLPAAMRRVICHTLESTIRFPIELSEVAEQGPSRPGHIYRRIVPPKPYKGLMDVVDVYHKRGIKISFITFNYDVCLDHALTSSGYKPEYWLGTFKPELTDKSVNLFKLHGSLNWARCQHCKKIVTWPTSEFSEFMSDRRWFGPEDKFVTMKISQHLHYLQHCDKSTGATEPVVVPPTWNKTQYHTELENVWLNAAAELADAENIFIIGYSLPGTDKFFHYLYALGSVGHARLKRFWVFNPDQKVEDRFKSILGQTALQRFKFTPATFEESFGTIWSTLGPKP
jgi:NAD-dependent SIR2 family protein deacetylase